jgi:hypothetical protein
MLQFQSPRFQGDALLEDILNDDPNTGTKNLHSGSPSTSVEKVQQALFDLHWPQGNNPPVTDASTFVIGVYGPATTEAVLRYKKHYDLHYPRDDPPGSGLVDGLAGPQTLAHLDAHIALLDEGATAIEAKAQDLQAQGVTVVLDTEVGNVPLLSLPGVMRFATIAGADGEISFRRGVGAHETHGNIDTEYQRQNGQFGGLGFPTSDEHDDGADVRRSDFEHGALSCDLQTGVVSVVGTPPPPPEVRF